MPRAMADQGADILDIGAESTRPYGGAKPVAPEDEKARLAPMLPAVIKLGLPVSIDTIKADDRRLGARSGRDNRQRRLGPATRSRTWRRSWRRATCR